MKCIILIIFGVMTFGLKAQCQCSVPVALNTFYRDDIGALTVEYIWNSTADTNQISISPVYYDYVAKGMAAIFNSSLTERDSVFNLYCIHSPASVSQCKGWIIAFDPNYSWTTAWKNVLTVTGNPSVDSLFSKYNLEVVQYFSSTNFVVVKSNTVLNPYPLMDSLLLIPGISWWSFNNVFNTNSYIHFTRSGNIREYEFTYMWNDCIASCNNSHTWKFAVDSFCNVSFIGSSDWWSGSYQPLPPPTGNCFATTSVNSVAGGENYKIYPNPVYESFYISLREYNRVASIQVTDMYGRVICSKVPRSEITSFDMHAQVKGIYFVRINTGNEMISRKVIKN